MSEGCPLRSDGMPPDDATGPGDRTDRKLANSNSTRANSTFLAVTERSCTGTTQAQDDTIPTSVGLPRYHQLQHTVSRGKFEVSDPSFCVGLKPRCPPAPKPIFFRGHYGFVSDEGVHVGPYFVSKEKVDDAGAEDLFLLNKNCNLKVGWCWSDSQHTHDTCAHESLQAFRLQLAGSSLCPSAPPEPERTAQDTTRGRKRASSASEELRGAKREKNN